MGNTTNKPHVTLSAFESSGSQITLETMTDRNYTLNNPDNFLHMVKTSGNEFIQTGNYTNANGNYSTFIPTMTGCISFEHHILHQKNSPNDFVAKFFVHDFTNNTTMPCSPYHHSSTDTVNTVKQLHLYNVCKGHQYAIGIRSDNPQDIITIMKGTKLTISPVINENSGITSIVTTSLVQSEKRQLGQLTMFKSPFPTESIVETITNTPDNIGHESFFTVSKKYNLKLHVSSAVIGVSNIQLPTIVSIEIIYGSPRQASVHTFTGTVGAESITTEAFTADLGTFEMLITPSNPFVNIRVTVQFPSQQFTLNSDLVATLFATPIVQKTETLLTSGNHLSLNSATEVVDPSSSFLMDMRGFTKPESIQLIKYTGNGPDGFYSSFVANKDMTVKVFYFVDVTSNVDKTISFSISRNNIVANPDMVAESILDISLSPNGLTERHEKSFTLSMKKGKEFFVHCKGEGNFTIGKTFMLHMEDISNG